jgi:hypothetical protein
MTYYLTSKPLDIKMKSIPRIFPLIAKVQIKCDKENFAGVKGIVSNRIMVAYKPLCPWVQAFRRSATASCPYASRKVYTFLL